MVGEAGEACLIPTRPDFLAKFYEKGQEQSRMKLELLLLVNSKGGLGLQKLPNPPSLSPS